MRLRFWPVIAVLLVGVLSTCSATKSAPPAAVDTSYARSGFKLGDGTTAIYYVKAFPANGVVRICGAWSVQSQSPYGARIAEDFLFKGRLYLGGTEVLKRLSFFEEFDPDQSPLGQPTACRDTGTPWVKAFDGKAPQAVFPRVGFSR
ncbi:MAG: hypothetical protein AAFP68_02575 [Pseudomonadota bacterium]